MHAWNWQIRLNCPRRAETCHIGIHAVWSGPSLSANSHRILQSVWMERSPWWYFAHAQDDLNLRILCMFVGRPIFAWRRNMCTRLTISFKPAHDKTYTKTCVTIKDSEQSVHPSSMARILFYPSLNILEAVEETCDQRRLWSDCADAQADQSLRWSHKSYYRFCRALAHFIIIIIYHYYHFII